MDSWICVTEQGVKLSQTRPRFPATLLSPKGCKSQEVLCVARSVSSHGSPNKVLLGKPHFAHDMYANWGMPIV